MQKSSWWMVLSIPVTAAIALMGNPVNARAQGPDAHRIENPDISISRPARGAAAIQALGARLGTVASRYGRTAANLRATLAQDHDLSVDKQTRLLYLCDG